jgi:hypothetical protein
MGNRSKTVLNQLVVEVDIARGLIFVSGNVPGPNGSIVEVRQARKRSIEPVKVAIEPPVSEEVTGVSEETASEVEEISISSDVEVKEQSSAKEALEVQEEVSVDGEEEQS